MASVQQDDDPFDSLFNLEDQYYKEGYDLGVADGSKAGRIEGRVFGLEKGFEKFLAMGVLAGRCAVWEARTTPIDIEQITDINDTARAVVIQPISANPRLEKHIQTLSALVEAESLATQNTEDAVSDLDDRLRRAEGKVKVIEKIIGEGTPSRVQAASHATTGQSQREVRVKRTGQGQASGESNMEDFAFARAAPS